MTKDLKSRIRDRALAQRIRREKQALVKPSEADWHMLYPVADVAAMLGLSIRTVYAYVRQGHLEAIKLPHGRIRFSEQAIQSFTSRKASKARESAHVRVCEGLYT